MSGFPILDLVVGIIFIFFLLSIICSSAVELWLSMRRTRARVLQKWLESIFNAPALKPDGTSLGKTLGQAIMDHCMVTGLSRKKKSPAYIDSQNFVSALLDQITRDTPPAGTSFSPPPLNLQGYIAAIQNSTVISDELKRTILIYATEAQQASAAINTIPAVAHVVNNITSSVKSEFEHFREKLERWYDTNGDRLTATFKRKKVLPLTIIIGAIITVALNADTVAISKYLYEHPSEAKQFSETALRTINKYEKKVDTIRVKDQAKNKDAAPAKDTLKGGDSAAIKAAQMDSLANAKLESNVKQIKQDIADMKAALPPNLPIGWKKNDADWWRHIPGWLATILAICLGAPFWFDILNKIANLRGTGPKPLSSVDDGKSK